MYAPNKEYGLIKPNKSQSQFKRLAAFADSDSDSDSGSAPVSSCAAKVNISLGETKQKLIRKAQENALAEDPTIFQYDELYDDMQEKRETQKAAKKETVKSAKYIQRLLDSAETRKKEYERRVERQVQKEREAEGEEFKDKESFVTSSYRAKLEEMKKAEEAEKRDEYLEAIGDVTKQRDLGGFYRHIYEQKMGPTDSVIEPPKKIDPNEVPSVAPAKKNRSYRKRKSSGKDNSDKDDDDDDEEYGTHSKSEALAKKTHLQSNLDADSDFSIDDSTDEEESPEKPQEPTEHTSPDKKVDDNAIFIKPEPMDAIVKVEKTENVPKIQQENTEALVQVKVEVIKAPKINIWAKRTVGDAFDAALQRYYERKVARESN